jgi:hypothetical protein
MEKIGEVGFVQVSSKAKLLLVCCQGMQSMSRETPNRILVF